MTDLELLKNKPEGASHVSIPSVLNIPVTWLRYDNDGIYSVWMDDGGTESKPYWREMPNNAIEFPECIRSIYDIEQLAKANERVAKPLSLIDFKEVYSELNCMQLWDWLMYNGYTIRKEQEQ